MNDKDASQAKEQPLLPLFGRHFLEDHARTIMSDPKIALIELIANCWDAGANRVDITWPKESISEWIKIEDDGTGMTYDEFTHRWRELNYNRKEDQGDDVVFPPGNKKSIRKAYGTNGKGRHSMFCFSNKYRVKTWKDGTQNIFTITRSLGPGKSPFIITANERLPKDGHGTIVSTELSKGGSYIEIHVLRDLIGAKFVTDPGFQIYVNGELVKRTEIEHFETKDIPIENIGLILLHCVDSQKSGRTSRQHGVAWWVNKRLVGEPSWRGFDDSSYLDRRTAEARRYTFIVEADVLADEVKEDWSDFKDTEKANKVKSIAQEHILEWLRELMKDVHKSRKKAALIINREGLKRLATVSRYHIGKFIDEIQAKVTVIDDKVLNATVEILSKLEQSRYGFALLEQLSELDHNDLDTLNEILAKWTVQEARIVLDELGRRLKVIEGLERLVENPSTDEVHQLQPLFEKGLWIFGPEFESIQFTSNRSLATVIRKLLGDKEATISSPRKRPDFIALPDSSMGFYSSDAFDERGEVASFEKVLIVELKRGGFEITTKEMRQADDYVNEIRRSGKVTRETQIEVFVLGTTIADDAREIIKKGDPTTHTKIQSETYSTTLRKAHARTFNLLKKIEQAKEAELYDKEVEEVLNEPDKLGLFRK